jgi:hypothetical protein
MDSEITKDQIEGINLTIKSVSKKYPFIKGWKFTDDYERWKSTLYIILKVDFDVLSEIYGLEFKDYYKNNHKNTFSGTLLSFFKNNKKDVELSNLSYDIKMEINKTITRHYNYLPEDMKIYFSYEYMSSFVMTIKIDNFLSV